MGRTLCLVPDLRADPRSYNMAYRAMIATYGIHNPYTGRGAIVGLRPHVPHSVRHVQATALVKETMGFTAAASLLLDTEETVRKAYARFLPGDRHRQARRILKDAGQRARRNP